MKKILSFVSCTVILLSMTSVYARDCTKDYLYDRQQSLVKYHFKGADGKQTEQTFGSWKDVPPNLKAMCWECWVDTLGWYQCKEMDPKNAPTAEPKTLSTPKNQPSTQPSAK